MQKPHNIPIHEYAYDLPDERIAKYPLQRRDQSKLLVYKNGEIADRTFSDVPELLGLDDHLFFNVTRVVQARMIFYKESGAKIEIFILNPLKPGDYQLAFSSGSPVEFLCMVGNAKKWKHGSIVLNASGITIQAEQLDRIDDKYRIRFEWTGEYSFAEILEIVGSTPIPPYLNRKAEQQDAKTYQTIYARQNGSVAAPTAGLHFSEEVLAKVRARSIKLSELTLHVGAGTFIPVKTDNAAAHQMHAEHVTVHRSLLESITTKDTNIAVGTTSTRSLESLYWLGVKAKKDSRFLHENIFLDQWEPYELEDDLSLEDSLQSLLSRMHDQKLESFSFQTRIMISPGYKFRVIDGLFTNFHQPGSTLLLLIAAACGDDWKKIYSYAMDHEYRFLSYGDSSLLYIRK